MKNLFLLFLIFFFSCKEESAIVKDYPLPFKEHVDSFIYNGQLRGQDYSDKSIIIKFDTLEEGVAGRTNYNNNGFIISINKKSWEGMDWYYRRILIWHELGHGLLNRGHNNLCNSIMNEELHICVKDFFCKNRQNITNELFTKLQ